MNKKIKAKWIKALRSGKYEQGYYSLKQRNLSEGTTYCCLGVLRDLISPRSMAWGNAGGLCAKHAKLCGLDRITQGKLIDMNDIKKHSFKRIATYIEKNL